MFPPIASSSNINGRLFSEGGRSRVRQQAATCLQVSLDDALSRVTLNQPGFHTDFIAILAITRRL